MKYKSIIVSFILCSFHTTYTTETYKAPSMSTKICILGIVRNNLSLVQCGILTGADVNFIHKHGGSLLHYACEYSEDTIVEELLNHPTIDITRPKQITHRFETDDTPLHVACYKNRFHIVDVLVSKNNTIATMPNKNGKTPFDYAMDYKNTQCIASILQWHPELATKPNKKGDLLRMAVNKGDQDCASLLLSLNRNNINAQDRYGDTALHLACKLLVSSNRILDLITLLIIHGACSTMKNNHHATPLFLFFFYFLHDCDSFMKNNPAIVEELIHAKDKHNNTQFHLCTETQLIDDRFNQYLSLLTSHGLDIHAKNNADKKAIDLVLDTYNTLYNSYAATKLPYIKKALDGQERIMHGFLQQISPHTRCAAFKSILNGQNINQFKLPQELIAYIMYLYYALNIETIVAKKYKHNDKYYNDFIENKRTIRQRLLENPEPKLLWSV